MFIFQRNVTTQHHFYVVVELAYLQHHVATNYWIVLEVKTSELVLVQITYELNFRRQKFATVLLTAGTTLTKMNVVCSYRIIH